MEASFSQTMCSQHNTSTAKMKSKQVYTTAAVCLLLHLTLGLFYGLPTWRFRDSLLAEIPSFEPCTCGVNDCTCGVLYVLSNSTPVIDMYKRVFASSGGRKPHTSLLPQAITAFRQHHDRGTYKIAVMIDDDNLLGNDVRGMIDFVGYLNTSSQTKPWAEALSGMLATPWTKTLYMDADTRICAPLDDVFELLNHVDIAAVPSRKETRKLIDNASKGDQAAYDYGRTTISSLIHPYSSFYAYRRSESAWRVLQRAKLIDDTTELKHMEALATAMREQTLLSFYALPSEYHWVNRTYEYPIFIAGQVRSLHGIETDCSRINTSPYLRLFDGDDAAVLRPDDDNMTFQWLRSNGSGVGHFRNRQERVENIIG